MSRFSKFFRLGWRGKLLFCEALLLHLVVGLVLKVVPFRRIPSLFNSQQSAVSSQQAPIGSQQSAVSSQQIVTIENIRVAVQRAGAVSPWRNRCLVSSLAGRVMLNRRKILSQLSLGVAKNAAGTTVAHAWLMSGDLEITGKHGDFHDFFVF